MSNKKLIFTADDSGVVKEIDDAVIDLVNEGILNSTEVLPNYFNADKSIHHSVINARRIVTETAASGNALELGIHLTITSGKPVSGSDGLEDILDESGRFISFHKLPSSAVAEAILREITAQADLLLSDNLLLPKITHISNHHDGLWFYPEYTKQLETLAKNLSLPIRSPKVLPKYRGNLYYVLKNKFKIASKNRMSRADRMLMEEAFHLREAGYFPEKTVSFVSTEYLDSSIYHALSQLFMSHANDLDKHEGKMRRDLFKMINRVDNNQTAEFMFHVYKGNFGNLNGSGELPYYNGINTGYFDGRLLEYRVLKNNVDALQTALIKAKIVMGGWSDLKTHYLYKAGS